MFAKYIFDVPGKFYRKAKWIRLTNSEASTVFDMNAKINTILIKPVCMCYTVEAIFVKIPKCLFYMPPKHEAHIHKMSQIFMFIHPMIKNFFIFFFRNVSHQKKKELNCFTKANEPRKKEMKRRKWIENPTTSQIRRNAKMKNIRNDDDDDESEKKSILFIAHTHIRTKRNWIEWEGWQQWKIKKEALLVPESMKHVNMKNEKS